MLHVSVRALDVAALTALGHSPRSACSALASRVLARGRGLFWLDSARTDPAGEQDEGARWSVLGDACPMPGADAPEVLRLEDPADPTVWGTLTRRLAPRTVVGGEGLPLRGGWVGFLSYELGVASLGVAVPGGREVPAALWVRPARYAVLDHVTGTLHCCVVGEDPTTLQHAADRWEQAVRAGLSAVPDGGTAMVGDAEAGDGAEAGRVRPAGDAVVEGRWRHDHAAYSALIRRCHRALRDGESYELCLTTRFEADPAVRIDPLALFEDLRAHHPTPYAALFEHHGPEGPLAVVSASPERFLSGRGGRYSTKPIKGTAAREPDPQRDAAAARALTEDPKTRAENLMIVDLLRNDLSTVCVPGSVQVPALMAVESYASVHQLVSTVTGTAREGVEPLDVVRALFPGGSMTGAPKRRTVELLTAWEAAPRGVYSGALGMFSADGAVELNIVIRTAVLAGGRWSIGAGGAIVADSDADAEYDEVLLKARSVRAAMARTAG
ncbi:anthranilate synthase component I family protein [Micrococcus sp.]|uniref:anthranilate synthase component I family protein n=1 Tax=Micrococcus sp. TaxID=1271 RepID=UPI002A90893B|nr:anthranilate synthase component I family protein [Micrococcus sp.]MDY6054715.1 anthranilate synthase component I family protein [Micrococcus sp.]